MIMSSGSSAVVRKGVLARTKKGPARRGIEGEYYVIDGTAFHYPRLQWKLLRRRGIHICVSDTFIEEEFGRPRLPP